MGRGTGGMSVCANILAVMLALLHRHGAGQPCGLCIKRYFAYLVVAHKSLYFCNGYIILVIGIPCCKHIFQCDRRIIAYLYRCDSTECSAGNGYASASLH